VEEGESGRQENAVGHVALKRNPWSDGLAERINAVSTDKTGRSDRLLCTGLANADPTDPIRWDLHQPLQRNSDMSTPTVANRACVLNQRTTVRLSAKWTTGLS